MCHMRPLIPGDTKENQNKIVICIICAQYARQMLWSFVMIVRRDCAASCDT
jgi:hypothetical protein